MRFGVSSGRVVPGGEGNPSSRFTRTSFPIFLISFLLPSFIGIHAANTVVERQVTDEREIYNLLQTCNNGSGIERAFWAKCLVEGHCRNSNTYWRVLPGAKLTEYNDGTADIDLTLSNIDNGLMMLEVHGTFTGRTSSQPSGSPKEGLCVGNIDNSDWYYYTGFSADMLGRGILDGAIMTLSRKGPAFQVGTGAGLTNMAYGGATWMNYIVHQQPHDSDYRLKSGSGMDFNFGLEETCPVKIQEVVLARTESFVRLIELEDGGTYHLDDFPTDFGIETIASGDVGSICYEVNNIEVNDNSYHYTYPADGRPWHPTAGTYEIIVKAYSTNNKQGILCDVKELTIRIDACENVENGGEIGYDQEICATPYDPQEIVSLSLPTGGTGAIEYLWLQSTTSCEPPTDTEDPHWEIIDGTDGPSYDPGPIEVPTCFIRCARREGCLYYAGESNVIRVAIGGGPDAEVAVQNPICGRNNGAISFTFPDTDGRTNIEFSKDGGMTYPLNTRDRRGSARFSRLSPGKYHLFVRWGNDDCPVDLGEVELVNESAPLTSAGRLEGPEKVCGPYDPTKIHGTNASGGHGGSIIYSWQKKTDGGWQIIPDAIGRDYDPGPISVTTRFRRRAKRDNNCGGWRYSNTITKSVLEPPVADFSLSNPTCLEKNGSITFSFPDNPSRTGIAFSLDGGQTYPLRSKDDAGTASFKSLAPGAYHLFVRWGNKDCPLDLGPVVLENVGQTILNGGQIAGNQRVCGPYIPNQITGTVPEGANENTILYRWQKKVGGFWEEIVGANAKDYTPEEIETSTWYRRLAKLDNECAEWRSSNTVDKHVLFPPSATFLAKDPTCGKRNGEISFAFKNYASRTHIEFSKDGGQTFPLRTSDRRGTAKFRRLPAGTYHLVVRWGNDECPVDLGVVELIQSSKPLTSAGRITGNQRACGSYDASIITGSDAFGGFGGEIIYQWQQKTTNSWENISGATGKDYDPGMIYQSTWFRRLAKRDNGCGRWRSSNTVDRHVLDVPVVTMETFGPDCGETHGKIKFTFDDHRQRTNIEFSKDGGQSFPLNVKDNVGTAVFNNVAPGEYNISVRWGNNECPVDLGSVEIAPASGPSVNPGRISSNQRGCGAYDSDPIIGTEADGGPGIEMIYQWQRKDTGSWEDIPGANGRDYDPPVLYQSTWYRRMAKNQGDCGSWKSSNTVDRHVLAPPHATFHPVHPECGEAYGKIAFYFEDRHDRTNIEFSRDGGNTFPLYVKDDAGTATFDELLPGTYHLAVRWGNDDCPVDLGEVTIVAPSDEDEDGICDQLDCRPDNAFYPAVPGTPCNDGDPMTIGDVVLEDKCTCEGEVPVCEVEACKVELDQEPVLYMCENGRNTTVSVTVIEPGVVPEGYVVAYLLTEGDNLLLEAISSEPSFTFNTPKTPVACTIHCFVYDPNTFDPNNIQIGLTTVADLNERFVTDNICADIDKEGAEFRFSDCAAIGNFVWEDININGIQDEGEPGIQGARIYLLNRFGKTREEVITDQNGWYIFGSLRPGDYRLQFVAPDGFEGSPRHMGTDDGLDSDPGFNTGMTGLITVESGQFDRTIDAGFYRPESCDVYCELQLDTDEEIYLCEMTSPSVIVEASSTGNDIIPNGYRVKYVLTDGDALLIEKVNDVPIFEVPKPQPGVCRVHCVVYDPDPESEHYFDDAMLNQFGTSLNDIKTAIDDAGICAYLDLDGVQFEFIQCVFIGDYVFEDSNRNGIQEENENGMADVKVQLRNALDDAVIRETFTFENGYYSFSVLPGGNYYLHFETPEGYSISPAFQGSDPALDSDIDPLTGQTTALFFPNATYSTTDWDAGFYDPTACYAYCELSLDQDPDIYLCEMTEPSVTISATPVGMPLIPKGYEVMYILSEGDELLFEKINDAPIFYVPKPEPGVCRVHCLIYDPDQTSDNYIDLLDNIQFRVTSLNQLAAEIEGEGLCAYLDMEGIPFEFIDCPLIGNMVFDDANANGIQDGGEYGFGGVSVKLLDANDLSVIQTTATDSDGEFYFSIRGGSYILEFETPAGYEITKQHQGTDFTKDSDIDPVTGRTGILSLPDGTYRNWDIDAGYVALQSLQVHNQQNATPGVESLLGLTQEAGNNTIGKDEMSMALQPEAIRLHQNQPNPFRDRTVIGFDLPQPGTATLMLTGISGETIKRITREFSAGHHEVEIDRGDLPSGLIHYTLITENKRVTKRMIVTN